MSGFRSEIAGLRALAVTAVVLFHLKVEAFQGGFVGVDVFFVISGYLISRNILNDLQANRFSFAEFYSRRIRRIFPALIFTVLITYLVGALWCSPLMFLDVAKEGTHALLSIANIQYWRESHAYFARSSDELALLHCWSLSAEEQFYAAWPLLLVIAHKLGRPFATIAVASLASLLAAVAYASRDSSAVFFLTPFRVYEFGCGALTIFAERTLVRRATRDVLSVAGILIICISTIVLRPDTPGLPLAILAPCLGTSAVIIGGSKTAGARVLSHPIAIGLGAISYSVYLCHWPIIYYGQFIFGKSARSVAGTVLILLTILAVGTLMNLFVERPFLRRSSQPTGNFRKAFIVFASIVLPIVALTHLTFLQKGLDWRITGAQWQIARLQSFPTGADIEPVNGPVAFQLVGDSHAVQYEAGLSIVRRRLDANMEILGGSNCPILYGVTLRTSRERQRCMEIRDRSLARIEQASVPMIFVQSWATYDDSQIDYDGSTDLAETKGSYRKLKGALEATMKRFAMMGKRVLLLGAQVNAECGFDRARLLPGPLPHAPLPPCLPGSTAAAAAFGEPFNAMLEEVQARSPRAIELLKPVDYLCDSTCPTMDGKLWLYFDPSHFTVAGSYFMFRRIEEPVARFLLSANEHKACGSLNRTVDSPPSDCLPDPAGSRN